MVLDLEGRLYYPGSEDDTARSALTFMQKLSWRVLTGGFSAVGSSIISGGDGLGCRGFIECCKVLNYFHWFCVFNSELVGRILIRDQWRWCCWNVRYLW